MNNIATRMAINEDLQYGPCLLLCFESGSCFLNSVVKLFHESVTAIRTLFQTNNLVIIMIFSLLWPPSSTTRSVCHSILQVS